MIVNRIGVAIFGKPCSTYHFLIPNQVLFYELYRMVLDLVLRRLFRMYLLIDCRNLKQ